MEITITINTDNAAFDDDALEPEVARILVDAALKFGQHYAYRQPDDKWPLELPLKDINGNRVGSMVAS